MTQAQLGSVLGRTQGNVGFYERGQTVPPEVAKRLLAYAREKGLDVTYEDVYGPLEAANDAAPEGQVA